MFLPLCFTTLLLQFQLQLFGHPQALVWIAAPSNISNEYSCTFTIFLIKAVLCFCIKSVEFHKLFSNDESYMFVTALPLLPIRWRTDPGYNIMSWIVSMFIEVDTRLGYLGLYNIVFECFFKETGSEFFDNSNGSHYCIFTIFLLNIFELLRVLQFEDWKPLGQISAKVIYLYQNVFNSI